MGREVGLRRPVGRDIGGESADTIVPTPAWRKEHFKTAWDRAWNPGDSIQLAIGQKDVAVTPLQMARFYAMIANGGKLVTPYVVSGVERPVPTVSEPAPSSSSRPTRRATPASTRLRSRRCGTGSTRRRT